METLSRRLPFAYSPLVTALVVGLFAYFALFLLTFLAFLAAGMVPPRSIWLGVTVTSLLGVILQFGSRRVLYFRIYDCASYVLAAAIYAILALRVLVVTWGKEYEAFVGVLIVTMLLAFGLITYVIDQRNPQRSRLPCAAIGKLDSHSGLIVDPHFVEKDRDAITSGNAQFRTILRLAPLIGGLSMLIARGVSKDVAVPLLFIPGILFASLLTWAASMAFSFCSATIHWERKHGKPIRVKR